MGNKKTIYAILIVAMLVSGLIFLLNKSDNKNIVSTNQGSSTVRSTSGDNVVTKDGKQIIDIDVKGGYWPRKTVAKAGIPTIIRFKTNNTFDCSIAVRLPSKGVSKMLSQTGSSDMDLGTSTVGQFYGTCGMGMYSFEIDFN